ncbi:hypothetical protein VR41_13625 [Streptomyces sp. NRRL B-1568]|nr:hypothetical protein VR41_13625 [Streptomyces sp. NRRL B-1568]
MAGGKSGGRGGSAGHAVADGTSGAGAGAGAAARAEAAGAPAPSLNPTVPGLFASPPSVCGVCVYQAGGV